MLRGRLSWGDSGVRKGCVSTYFPHWATPITHYGMRSVKLITGSLSHENTGNQFGHASVIFTFILLAVTAVAQIICLNRGLKVYDSTLVVPVFYGVYTALG